MFIGGLVLRLLLTQFDEQKFGDPENLIHREQKMKDFVCHVDPGIHSNWNNCKNASNVLQNPNLDLTKIMFV